MAFAAGTSPRSVKVGDVNSDGKADLVVANIGSNNVSVLLGTGTTTPLFQSAVNYAVGANPNSVALTDLSGDGICDLVVTNSGDNTVSVLLGAMTVLSRMHRVMRPVWARYLWRWETSTAIRPPRGTPTTI